jgi:tight adherence protein B
VNALAGCLIACMVWCIHRARRTAQVAHVPGRLRRGAAAPGGSSEAEDRPRRLFSRSLPWVLAGAIAGWLVIAPVAAAIGALAGWAASLLWFRRVASRSAAAWDEQLADVVGAVAAAMRSGLSMPQALGYAADESPEPIDGSLRRLVERVDIGVPIDTAVSDWAHGVGTDDARLLAGVLRLHRRTGGDLPAVLDQVGATLRDRRAAAQEVTALTAQARLSGAILGFLPIGFFGFLWLTSRSDIQVAFHTPAGLAAIAVGLALEGIASLWIRHLLAVRL